MPRCAGLLADTQVRQLQNYLEQHPAPTLAGRQRARELHGRSGGSGRVADVPDVGVRLRDLPVDRDPGHQFNSFFQTLLVLSAVLFSTAAGSSA